MKSWPSDPLRQSNLVIAAFCDDLFDRCVTGSDPKSRDRIAEINHQINSPEANGLGDRNPAHVAQARSA